jgi:hypothetical protein
MRLKQTFINKELVKYKVETSDFSQAGSWDNLGTLQISKSSSSYQFTPSQLAIYNKLIPPELYGLSSKERQNKLDNKYSEYGLGAWSICIHHWASSLISNKKYPTEYPNTL